MTDSVDPLDSLQLRPLPGSERPPTPGIAPATACLVDSAELEATLILRRRAELPESAFDGLLSPAEFAQTYGALPADIDLVTGTLTSLGARILQVDPASRRVRIFGTFDVRKPARRSGRSSSTTDRR
jgi:kumamolisin